MKTAPLVVAILLCAVTASAQAISPECAPAQEQLKAAEVAGSRNDWQTASNHYREAVQVAPSCLEALVNLGVVYNRLNQSEEAVKTLKQALAANPQLFPAHLNLGITYFRTTRYD